jgi:SAM-dependent methyltransferase
MKNYVKRPSSFPGDTYGEVTEKGVSQLIEYFSEYFDNPDGVFYDLGSGKGRLCIQVAKETNISKVVGIELHKERHLQAEELLKKSDVNNVSFIEGDFLAYDLSDATIIFASNEAMPREVTYAICDNAPKGCLIILGRDPNLKWRTANPDQKFKMSKAVHKTYASNKGNWYTLKNK